MKTKIFILSILTVFLYVACEDTISKVGMGIQPEGDKVSVFDTTLSINASTIKIDSIYAKTITGYLGEIYDPDFGTIKSSFACQYYPALNFELDSMINDKIDSVRLVLYFHTFLGDTLAPMEMSIYPVIKPLDKDYYTNIDPTEFCDMDNPIAKYGYTVRNPHVNDSLIGLGYYRGISVPLPVEFGEKFLAEAKKPEPNGLSSVENFTKFFPGTYITTTSGFGSMIASEHTRLYVYYTRRYTVTGSAGQDSTVIGKDLADFRVTKEVIQLNSFQNKNDGHLLIPNDDSTFIKSPVGVYTKLTIPVRAIMDGVGERQFSGISLTVKAYEKNAWKYGFDYPGLGAVTSTTGNLTKSKLLLIEPDSVKNFFEMQSVADSKTSYATTFNTSTYSYSFANISNIVQNAIEKAPDKDLELLLIPVQTSYTQQQSSYLGSYVDVDYKTNHYLYPTSVTLKKDTANLKIRVVATDLEINQ